jgi:hypothetical protein
VSTGPASSNEPLDAWFEGASPDGRRVFFSTREKLVPEDTDHSCARPGFPQGCNDLYERSNGVTRLIAGAGGGAGFGAVSSDGKRLFISTTEPLVPEDTDWCTDVGCIGVYELRDGALRLMSTGPTGGNGNFHAEFLDISKDGSRVFFRTQEPLSAADVDGAIEDIYERVDSVTNLISIGPASPTEQYGFRFNDVSDDGRRVFFTTLESLVPEDRDCITRWAGCPDVYERFDGTTTLITRDTADCDNDSGERPYCPAFVGAPGDGRRVFFVTPESLVPEDTDALNDLYVAIAPSRACRSDKPGKRPKKCDF